MPVKIAPSILAADFSRLGELVRAVEQAGADRIHIDVMDGHFVPNLSMGPVVVRGLRPATRLPLEVHLMVERPADFVPAFIDAGADSLIFHVEPVDDPMGLIRDIRARGARVGMAVKPGTPVAALEHYLSEIDLALSMTVEPGFGGQAYLEDAPERVAELRRLIEAHHPACELEVDGGIDAETGRLSARNGATVLVAGTSVFGSPGGPGAGVRALLSVG